MSAFKFFPDDTLITHNQEEVVGREIRYKICKYAEINIGIRNYSKAM